MCACSCMSMNVCACTRMLVWSGMECSLGGGGGVGWSPTSYKKTELKYKRPKAN